MGETARCTCVEVFGEDPECPLHGYDALLDINTLLLSALERLLPEVDAEIDQRRHSGNDEDWRALKALSDLGHSAVAKAKGTAT